MNIDRYRPLAAVVIVSILTLTNLAHLIAYTNGRVGEYSAKWDMPQIKILNLILIGLLVGFALIRPTIEEEL